MRRFLNGHSAPLFILAVTLVIAYWRLWLGEAFFWGLPALQFVPWRAYGLDALRAGYLPLWNPYNGAGAPLLANYQSAFFYPLNWPGLLMPTYAALGWLMSLTAVVHLFIGGVGMWLFTGQLRYDRTGRGVSTLAYALTLYVVARLGTYPIVSVTAWIPFLLWAVRSVLIDATVRHYGWLALVVALLLLGGHAQTAWYTLLLAGLYALWIAIRYRAPISRIPLGLAALALGCGIATLQLAATADLTLQSARADGYGAVEEVFRYSYRLPRAITLIAPNFYGNPGDGSYLGRGLAYEYGTYVGIITLVAAMTAILAMLAGRARRDSHLADGPFWTAILVVGFVLALGDATPIYPWLYNHIPSFDTFQAPVRWHIWTVTALAVLGGAGVQSWGVGPRIVFGTRLATAGAVGGALLAVGAPFYLPSDILSIDGVLTLVRAIGEMCVMFAAAGLLTLLKRGNVPTRFKPLPANYDNVWGVLVLVVLAADLGWAGRGLNPTVSAAFYNPLDATPTELTDASRRGYWTPDSLDLLLFGQAVTDEGIDVLSPDELGFTPLLYPADYRAAQDSWQMFRQLPLPNMNLLDRAYLLNNNEPLQLAAPSNFVSDLPLSDAILEANRLSSENDAAVSQLYTLTPDGEVVTNPLETFGRVLLLDESGVPMPISYEIMDGYNRTTITFDAVPQAERLTLILHDVYMPGWVATVDSMPVKIESGPDGMSRILEDMPPAREIIFTYSPSWLLYGGAVSGVSLLLWGWIMWVGRKRRTSPRSTT